MTSDEKLIEGCIAGQRQAQSLLYKKFSPVMFGICLRYAKTRAEAEDLLQEGFLKVFGNLALFRSEGSFEGWIRRIFVNTAINYYHSSSKNQVIATENIEQLGVELEEDQHDWGNDQEFLPPVSPEKVMQMIQQLPDGYRMVMNMYVFEGHTHKEIGEMLGISENTSKSQLSKARRYLKSRLSEKNEKVNNSMP